METLHIAELIGTSNAILQKFGLKVYSTVGEILASHKTVALDFSGISNATTGFFHASVGNLRRDLGENYSRFITIVGLDNPIWKEKYDEAIEFAVNPEQAHQIDSAISELFA